MDSRETKLYLAYLEYETLEKPYKDKFDEEVNDVFKKYGTPYISPSGIRGIQITDEIREKFIAPLSHKLDEDTKIFYQWWQQKELVIRGKYL